MISSFACTSQPSLLSTGADTIVSLNDRLQQNSKMAPGCSGNDVANNTGLDFDSEPLVSAFLEDLLQLPPANDPLSYASGVSELMRTFLDPKTGKLAFSTLEQQTEILQRTLDKVGNDASLSEPLTTTLLGTTNLQFQMTKWMQDVVLSGGEIKESEDW